MACFIRNVICATVRARKQLWPCQCDKSDFFEFSSISSPTVIDHASAAAAAEAAVENSISS